MHQVAKFSSNVEQDKHAIEMVAQNSEVRAAWGWSHGMEI